MRKYALLTFILVLTILLCNASMWAESVRVSGEQTSETVNDENAPKRDAGNKDDELDHTDIVIETTLVKDPIQPYNRAIFTFNDKFYYYVIRPPYKGYNVVVPEKARSGVYNEFNEVSLDKGETYESITKPAIDPYIAVQDAYTQNRVKKIKE